jgi:hypothetical protein
VSDSREWIPVAGDFERVATHEAGHTVAGLALGVAVAFIEFLTPENVPQALRDRDFHGGLAVQFSPVVRKLEPRRQFLIALGGIAAEQLVFQKHDELAASADFDCLKPNVLAEPEVTGLIVIAQRLLTANLNFFHRLRESLRKRLESSSDRILLQGAGINVNFRKTGNRPDVSADLDALLPL